MKTFKELGFYLDDITLMGYSVASIILGIIDSESNSSYIPVVGHPALEPEEQYAYLERLYGIENAELATFHNAMTVLKFTTAQDAQSVLQSMEGSGLSFLKETIELVIGLGFEFAPEQYYGISLIPPNDTNPRLSFYLIRSMFHNLQIEDIENISKAIDLSSDIFIAEQISTHCRVSRMVLTDEKSISIINLS
jgi:hypothetical protein